MKCNRVQLSTTKRQQLRTIVKSTFKKFSNKSPKLGNKWQNVITMQTSDQVGLGWLVGWVGLEAMLGLQCLRLRM